MTCERSQVRNLYRPLYRKWVTGSNPAVPKGALRALKEAQKEGKIKFIGVSDHNLETLLLAAKTGFDVLMINFKEQEAAEKLLPYCQKENIGVIVMKPLVAALFKMPPRQFGFVLANQESQRFFPEFVMKGS